MTGARLGLVVQVRLGSTRLPRKALLPLGGATVTDQVLRRLALVPADAYVLATDEASAAELGPIAARNGFELLVGSAEDVLARYCDAIRRFGLSRLLRATGDNPLVSFELARLLVEEGSVCTADGVGTADGTDYRAHTGMPLGMGVELVEAPALLAAEKEASLPSEREHVCPFLYSHPERFRILRSEAPAPYRLPEARVTIDTAADYESVLRLYGALYAGSPIPSEAVLRYLSRREP
jgi:spore coat polysaccharide biosynthesis protein SpsF